MAYLLGNIPGLNFPPTISSQIKIIKFYMSCWLSVVIHFLELLNSWWIFLQNFLCILYRSEKNTVSTKVKKIFLISFWRPRTLVAYLILTFNVFYQPTFHSIINLALVRTKLQHMAWLTLLCGRELFSQPSPPPKLNLSKHTTEVYGTNATSDLFTWSVQNLWDNLNRVLVRFFAESTFSKQMYWIVLFLKQKIV